jgi:transposase
MVGMRGRCQMARPRKKLDEQGESKAVLSKLKQTHRGDWEWERLHAVKLGLEGKQSLEQIAESVGRARSCIQRWFDLYRSGGTAGLLKKPERAGRPGKVVGKVSEALVEKLREGDFRTAEQARNWLAQKHGVEVKGSNIYHVLKKHEGCLKVPRPVHRNQDPEQRRAFKTTLCDQLDELAIEPEKRVRIWVQDEMRYGLMTIMRRVWGVRGLRVIRRSQQKFDCGHLFGSVEVNGQGAEFTYLQYATKETTLLHVRQVAETDPDAVHVFIWDGAGFHQRDGEETLPENVRLITLPPYCPELNPIEKLWDHLKDTICNRIDDTIEQLEKKMDEFLKAFWESPERIASLVGDGWMLSEVNAT